MTTRIVSLELENFRGFSGAQQIDLDADVVLVRGDNGTGKTSLTDGILWVLVGELEHLSERVRGLRQTHDPIANRYVEPLRDSRVALSVRRGSDVWKFERIGNAKRSRLDAKLNNEPVAVDDALLEAFDHADLNELRTAVRTWGLLRQDAIRSVLDTGGAALHQRMSAIVGLDEVTRFVEACRAGAKSAAARRKERESPLTAARNRLDEARKALQAASSTSRLTRADVARTTTEALSNLSREVRVAVEQLETLDDLTRLGRSLSRLILLAEAPVTTYAQLIRDQAAITKSSDQLKIDLEAAESQANRLAQDASDSQRLAEAALNLLSDHCPVCSQAIDPVQVAARLELILEQSGKTTAAASEARTSYNLLLREVSKARSLEAGAIPLRQTLAAQMSALRHEIASTSALFVDESLLVEASLESLSRRLDDVRSGLRRAYAEISAESSMNLERLEAESSAAAKALESARTEHEEAKLTAETAKLVEKAAQQASDQIVARLLHELEPSFSEVFDRLAPHPTFSELRARQDVYYNKNQIVPDVNDPIRGVSANPLLVYSEGQLNTVALSYFLGLAFNAPSDSIGFMVLDDPLQAMDVLAVLGFADLCRRLRDQRQLIITTHDRRYATLLDRKLAPRESGQTTLVHEFGSWSPLGPLISTVSRDYEAEPPVLWGQSA